MRHRSLPRLTGRLSPLEASALVACALNCLETAVEAWVDQGGRGTLESFYAEAVAAVRGL